MFQDDQRDEAELIGSVQDARSAQLHHFLGIKVLQNLVEGKVWIGQQNYVQKMLERFGMQDSKPVSTPSAPDSKLIKKTADDEEANQKKYQEVVGSLLYLSTQTRPDIAFSVGNVARFCSEPTQVHFSAVKWLYCKHSTTLTCIGYSDADWGGSLKSTSGYVFSGVVQL